MVEVPLETVVDPDDCRLALVFVTMEINGSPVRALLDSGARRTAWVPPPDIAMPLACADRGTGAFGVASPLQRTRASVRFGGRDLGMMDVSVVASRGLGSGNLLGQDVLSQFRCEYRLAEQRLRLDGELPYEAEPIRLDVANHIYIDATWSGIRARANAVFDTGSSVTIVDQNFYSRHLDLFSAAGTAYGTDAAGVVMEAQMATMRGPVLLGQYLSDSLVAIVDLDAANATVDWHMDIILGWPITSQAAWFFDHAQRIAGCSPFLPASSRNMGC